MKRRRESTEELEQDMLEALQGQTYKDGRTLSDKEIAHIMIALLMAGQHTSAATGSWLLLHLGDRLDLQQDLYQEQVAVWGNEDGSFKPLNYENLQTPLLNSCIREVLRLHPPLHSLMRKVLSDLPVPIELSGEVPQPLVVPKGHYVLAAPGVSQVDPHFWKDAQTYDPKRWVAGGQGAEAARGEEEEEKFDFGFGAISTGASSHYLPFGAGRHRCIGEQFAQLQLAVIFATLIRHTTWKNVGKVPGQNYQTMVVMPLKPCDVDFKLRSA